MAKKRRTWLIMDGRASDGESFHEATVIEVVGSDEQVYTDRAATAYLKRKHEGYDYCVWRADEDKEAYLVASLLTGFGYE